MRPVTIDTGGRDDIFPGALVLWLHTPRGGYGYTIQVSARVIRVKRDRVRIAAKRQDGSEVERSVLPEKLRWGKV